MITNIIRIREEVVYSWDTMRKPPDLNGGDNKNGIKMLVPECW
jgi:hypothetical protein